jgi:PAS domain S-box-containing protein
MLKLVVKAGMKTIDPGESSLLTKRNSFERMTQIVRWLVIFVVAATFWTLPHNKFWMTVLMGAAIAYNLLRMTPLSKIPPVNSFIVIIAMDMIFATLAIIVTGGIDSPYMILLAPMIITAAFWYGAVGLGVTAAVETVFVGVLLYYSDLPVDDWPLALAPLALILIIAYYVSSLTQDDREERTELRQLNTAVQRERRQLESLVNSLKDGVMAVDSNGLISLANKSASSLFDLTELIGRSFDEAIELYDSKGNRASFFGSGSSEQEISRSDLVKRMGEDETALEVRLTPFEVGNEPQGTIIFIRDITKQKSLDEERDEFISLASHELRTPLALIEGNLSLAKSPSSGQLNDRQTELLKKTYRNVRHLSAIVADLTTLDQADKGMLDVELERIDIGEIIKELVADNVEQATEKGLELTYEVDSGVKPVVTSKFRLVEILTNFLSNAIKYTSKSGSVIVRVVPDAHSGGAIVSVTDTGVGISATDKRKIFDKFYRSEDYHTRETEGTGLGLYIVRKLAARLNGEVWLTSELGKGTTFYLRVPQYSKFREDQPKVIAADVDSFIKGV